MNIDIKVERDLRNKIMSRSKDADIFCLSIEQVISNGVPDLLLAGKDFYFFCELKIANVGRVKLRKTQTSWAKLNSKKVPVFVMSSSPDNLDELTIVPLCEEVLHLERGYIDYQSDTTYNILHLNRVPMKYKKIITSTKQLRAWIKSVSTKKWIERNGI